jgi:hypothetical protein
MKALGARTRDIDDLRILANILGITTADTAIQICANFYPDEDIPPLSRRSPGHLAGASPPGRRPPGMGRTPPRTAHRCSSLMPVTDLHHQVAAIALHAASGHGFALAGGNALLAHGVITRATQDVEMSQGLAEWIITAPGGQQMMLQLAYFTRTRHPVTTDLGPVLDLDDVAGAKVCALASRIKAPRLHRHRRHAHPLHPGPAHQLRPAPEPGPRTPRLRRSSPATRPHTRHRIHRPRPQHRRLHGLHEQLKNGPETDTTARRVLVNIVTTNE